MLADFYSMANYSITVRGIPIRIAGVNWARRQLHAGIRYVPTLSILMELQAGDLQNSMADYSTTVPGIPIRIAGGCWARRQLHAGIRYVPVASKHRILLASVEGDIVPWRNSTRWLIPPQTLEVFQFGLREVVGLDVSFTPV